MLVAVLLSAVATEFIGIHAIFGAFLLGAIMPHDSQVADHVHERIEDIVRVMFLPAFFAFTGLRTEIGLRRRRPSDWLWCAAIIVVATVGKFGGTTLAARLLGLDWRDSGALGILMNTRGLVELIVLNIGLDLGVHHAAPVHDAGDHGDRHDDDDLADPDGDTALGWGVARRRNAAFERQLNGQNPAAVV